MFTFVSEMERLHSNKAVWIHSENAIQLPGYVVVLKNGRGCNWSTVHILVDVVNAFE